MSTILRKYIMKGEIMVIKVDNLSVKYMIGDFKNIGFKEFVVQKATGTYNATEFWAVKNVSFSLEKGDFLGIIGTNGAGKSTLLKTITGILQPQKGYCTVDGNIAALLELGTGFDADLTLRENIYLRGALLGYTEQFIQQMIEDILEFAELKHVENRKYKQLSSGMRARLAFSISCLVNPDILILDEVLSVGDASFRKKSEAKMFEIIKGGATTLMVTHSLAQVRRLCNKVLWLHQGEQMAFGETKPICDMYEQFLKNGNKMPDPDQKKKKKKMAPVPKPEPEFQIPFVPYKEPSVLSLPPENAPVPADIPKPVNKESTMKILEHMEDCTGCGACANACPKSCIKMTPNENGFAYPVVDMSLCVNCGKCQKTCPVNHKPANTMEPECYALMAPDEIRLQSSSGGAFTLLANRILEDGGVVAGVGYDENMVVRHMLIDSPDELYRLRGSKYVQSDTGMIYQEIKQLLQNGRKVLFSGTPCQAAGLHNYLGKEYENLITVDLLCHGVPSPRDFKDTISAYKTADIKNVQFRDFKKANDSIFRVDFKNGRIFEKRNQNSKFINAFHKNLILRSSCHTCKFNTGMRPADISIGDFWGIDKLYPEMYDNQGVSCILINSPHGKAFFDTINMDGVKILKVSKSDIEKGNSVLRHPPVPSKNRERYFALRRDHDFVTSYLRSTTHFNVGFVAYMSNNYGSIATNYALYKSLESMNLSVVLLNNIVPIRGKMANQFAANNMRLGTNQKIGYEDEEMNQYFDSFIIGSDQIWHPFTPFCKEHMGRLHLEFADLSKRVVAYGASYGIQNMNIQPEIIRMQYSLWKQRFDYIGLREDYSVRETKEYFGADAQLVIDPVFLCDKKNYEHVISYSSYSEDEPYILAYILDYTEEKKEFLQKMEKKLGKKLIIMVDLNITKEARKNWNCFENIRENLKLSDWLYYIRNCDYMITDSFHGSCFSLIFNRNFAAIKNRQKGRFNTLGQQMGIPERMIDDVTTAIDDENLLTPINYQDVNQKLRMYVEEGYAFLRKALIEPRDQAREAARQRAYHASRQLQLLLKKASSMDEVMKEIGYVKDERDTLRRQETEKHTHLAAIQQYYGIKPDKAVESAFHYSDTTEEYFRKLNLKDTVIFIAAKDTVDKYAAQFIEKSGLPLTIHPKFRNSYIAVLDGGRVVYEKADKHKQHYSYQITADPSAAFTTTQNGGLMLNPEMFKSAMLVSAGFNPENHTSNANILINNIDYSRNAIGLNIVVYSKKTNGVIDSFTVDAFRDKDLKITRI